MKNLVINHAKRTLFYSLLLSLISINLLSCKNKKTVPKKPNVLFVLMDDTGYSNLGCTGNPIIKTPNIDEMYNHSVRLSNFCVSPTCSPTRAALMTGKSEFKSNVTHTKPGRSNLDLNATTIMQLFKQQGYATGMFGKWHIGNEGIFRPEHRGFDEAVTVKGANRAHYDPVIIRNGVEEQAKGFRTDIIFKEAMGFIEKNKDKPFFCYLPTHSAHVPFKAPKKYCKPYEGIKGVSSKHYGMIVNIDYNMGLIIDKLKVLGLEENTLVIFMSDNGPVNTYYTAGMRGRKNLTWYGGVRVNSFWKWPAKLKAGDRSLNTSAVDFFSTIADVIDADIPKNVAKDLEGSSLLPYMINSRTKEGLTDRMLVHHMGRWADPLAYNEHKYAHCTVRWKNYQLIRTDICKNTQCNDCMYIWNNLNNKKRNRNTGIEHYKLLDPRNEWALFDLKSDLHQDHNIANNHPEIVTKMSNFYENWWDEVENKLDKYNEKLIQKNEK